MRILSAWLVAVSAVAVFPVPAFAEVLADCAASKGKAFYLGEGAWSEDGISSGNFIITEAAGVPGLIFRNGEGATRDAKSDGAKVRFTFVHEDTGEFGILVAYEPEGIVETYNVLKDDRGRKRLFWTSNRSSGGSHPKVAAYTAICR